MRDIVDRPVKLDSEKSHIKNQINNENKATVFKAKQK